MRALTVLLLGLIAGSLAGVALAEPLVPGFTVSTYAIVTDPIGLSFDPSGTLFVGRDSSGSTGGSDDAVRIHRVGPGGAPVVEYGTAPIPDPDAVLFDATGRIAGTPGSVLVAGDAGPGGQVVAILPDQSLRTIFGPTAAFRNPNNMVFDATGRLLIADPGQAYGATAQVLASAGGFPATLFTLPSDPFYIALDPGGRIFTSARDGTIRVHAADGSLVNGAFATGLGGGPVAFGKGGAFGTDLYAVNAGNGNLVRFDSAGNATVVGTGFESAADLAFGADGALHVSLFAGDRIVRIAAAGRFAMQLSCPATAGRGSPFSATLTFKNDSGASRDVTRGAVALHAGELRLTGPAAVEIAVAVSPGAEATRAIPIIVPAQARSGSFLTVGVGVLGRVGGDPKQKTLGALTCIVEVTR